MKTSPKASHMQVDTLNTFVCQMHGVELIKWKGLAQLYAISTRDSSKALRHRFYLCGNRADRGNSTYTYNK